MLLLSYVAIRNNALTSCSDSPIHLLSKDDADREKKVAPNCDAKHFPVGKWGFSEGNKYSVCISLRKISDKYPEVFSLCLVDRRAEPPCRVSCFPERGMDSSWDKQPTPGKRSSYNNWLQYNFSKCYLPHYLPSAFFWLLRDHWSHASLH